MSILTHHFAFDQFDLIADEPAVTEYSSLDHAFQLGWDAMSESLDAEDVFPPADFTPAEAKAFRDGAIECCKAIEHEMALSRTPMSDDDAEDMYQDWLYMQERRGAFCGHDSTEAW